MLSKHRNCKFYHDVMQQCQRDFVCQVEFVFDWEFDWWDKPHQTVYNVFNYKLFFP